MDIIVDKRTECDIELIVNGGMFPLKGFMTKEEYELVVERMELPTGDVFPLPVILRLTKEQYDQIHKMDVNLEINLLSEIQLPIAKLKVTSIYEINIDRECDLVYGTRDMMHPYVNYICSLNKRYAVGGKLKGMNLPYECGRKGSDLFLSPLEVKSKIKCAGWNSIVAFQTRNPLHRSHYETTLDTYYRVRKEDPTTVLWIHPVIGVTQDNDISDAVRILCYKKIKEEYPVDVSVFLSLLRLSMRMAGPREAIWHALIRANYGATHFIVGRDHASPSNGSPYGIYDAHHLGRRLESRLPIKLMYVENRVYVPIYDIYCSENEVIDKNISYKSLSGTEIRKICARGDMLPSWYTFPSISCILEEYYRKSGICIYFVGLSGSGKTTIGRALQTRLQWESAFRKIRMIDGDDIRKRWKYPLGFRREDRSLQTRIIGNIANAIVGEGGICIVANIAPYLEDRNANREWISSEGRYIQVYVKTPLEICRERDPKGLYKMAEYGNIKLTGVNDPFEDPVESDIIIDGTLPIYENIDRILSFIYQ